MVEFAIVLPVFLLLLLGIVEFGRAFMVYQVLTNAAREGARTAILSYTTSDTQVRSRVANFLTAAKVPTDKRLKVTVTSDRGKLTDAIRGDSVQVNVSIAYSDVSLMAPRFLSRATLTATSHMRRE